MLSLNRLDGFTFRTFIHRAEASGQRRTAARRAAVESLEPRRLLSAVTTLASFTTSMPGDGPQSGPILFDNTLYGTSQTGGSDSLGEVYSVSTSGGTPTVLGSFDSTDGSQPVGPLLLSGTTLYGTISQGGANNVGGVFSLPLTGGTPTLLASFDTSDGASPLGGLILSGSTLYGTTAGGGADSHGAVFSLPVSGGTPTLMASFDDTDGAQPVSALVLSGSTLYGMTEFGGASAVNGEDGDGVVFSLPLSGGTPNVLTSFDLTDGSTPRGDLTLMGSTLYGTTAAGGADNAGEIFSLPTSGGTPSILASLNGTTGDGPAGGVLISGSTLYSTEVGVGTVYSLPITGGTPTVIGTFPTSPTNISAAPLGDLVLSNSTLYGATQYGGTSGDGSVFSLSVGSSESAPTINTNPTSQTIAADATATFTAAATGTAPVTVQWQDSTNSGASFSNLSGQTSTTLQFVAQTDESGYEYQAVFTNGGGSTTTSAATLTVTGTAPSTAPTDLAATQGTLARHVEVTWDAVSGATSYQVFRGTSSSSLSQIATDVTTDAYADTSATPGVLYYYAVRAVNASGNGPTANPVTGYLPLAAPADLAATNSLPKHIAVTWDAVPDAVSYQVFRGTSSSNEVKIAAGITTTGYADLSAVQGTIYDYSVRAVNSVGIGLTAGPVTGFKCLPAPTDLTATDDLSNEVTISWDAVAGADTYQVFRGTTDDFNAATNISGTVSGLTFNDTTAASDQLYYYWVRARIPGDIGADDGPSTGEKV